MQKHKQRKKHPKDFFEKDSWSNDQLIIGVDEVGRGCSAGPVVAGAVILKWKRNTKLLKDSKILTLAQREHGYEWIKRHSWASVGIVNNETIDRINIYWATLLAMRKAVLNVLALCPHRPEKILIDAMPLDLSDTSYSDITIHHFPFGEEQSSSIAAASIWAKVTRDRLMQKMDLVFPGYHLGKHKGYNTPEHKKLIRQHGHSIAHRIRFLRNTVLLTGLTNDYKDQQILFNGNNKHKTVC